MVVIHTKVIQCLFPSWIIDDIQDRSEMRRGKKCVHHIYGEPLSINAGCACYFLGQEMLNQVECTDDVKLRMYQIWIEAWMIAEELLKACQTKLRHHLVAAGIVSSNQNNNLDRNGIGAGLISAPNGQDAKNLIRSASAQESTLLGHLILIQLWLGPRVVLQEG